MSVIFSAGIACVVLAVSFAFVLRKLAFRRCAQPAEQDLQWIPFEPVSIERYRPMERLLNEHDFRCLQAKWAFDRKRLRELRAQRRRIFRAYLAHLTLDYTRVCAAAKLLLVNSVEDRPDLAVLLIKQRLAFTLALAGAESFLALEAVGLGSPQAWRLVVALHRMSLILNELLEEPVESSSLVTS